MLNRRQLISLVPVLVAGNAFGDNKENDIHREITELTVDNNLVNLKTECESFYMNDIKYYIPGCRWVIDSFKEPNKHESINHRFYVEFIKPTEKLVTYFQGLFVKNYNHISINGMVIDRKTVIYVGEKNKFLVYFDVL